MKDYLLSDSDVQNFIVNGYVQVRTDLPESVHRTIFDKSNHIFSDLTDPKQEITRNPQNNILPVVPELQQIVDAPHVKGALTSLLGENYVMLPHRHCHPNFTFTLSKDTMVVDDRRLTMKVHKDGHAGAQKPRHRVPRWVILFYYPQECTDDQGPTVIIPRSHYQHNLARTADGMLSSDDPLQYLERKANGNYELPENYIYRTLMPLSGGLGDVSIMHFDVGHSVVENLASRHRYGQKFVFMRTEEPTAPTWNNEREHWEQPDTANMPDHEILWTYIWNWMRGNPNRYAHREKNAPERFSLDELNHQLLSSEPKERLRAANEIGFLGANNCSSEGIVSALLKTLRDDDYEPVRLNAVYALGAIGSVAKEPLLNLLNEDEEFFSIDPVTHVSIAAHGLGAIGTIAIDSLEEKLTASKEQTRAWAAYALGEIGRAASTALPSLLEAASDSSPDVRRHVLSAIGIIATCSDDVEATLVERLQQETDSQLRQYVLQAMFRIGPSSAKYVPIIARFLDDDDGYVGAYTAEQLYRTASPEAYSELLPYLRRQRWFPDGPHSKKEQVDRPKRLAERIAQRKRALEVEVIVGGG